MAEGHNFRNREHETGRAVGPSLNLSNFKPYQLSSKQLGNITVE